MENPSQNISKLERLTIPNPFLKELGERIKTRLGLRDEEILIHLNKDEDYKTGLLEFKKEDPYQSGTQLPLIVDITKNFYIEKGFNILECKETPSSYKNEFLVIPKDYYKSFSMSVERDKKEYYLSFTQGDEYDVWIIGGLFNLLNKF